MIKKDSEVKCFDNEGAQVAACVGGAVVLVIGLGALWGELGFAAVVLPLSIIFIVRSVKSSNVVVDRSGVTTRSLFRTRRYPFQELREVEVACGRTGPNGFGREYLVFSRVDGQTTPFKDLNCRVPKAPKTTSVVRSAAEYINERVHQN